MTFAGRRSPTVEPSGKETKMASITELGRVMVPVSDQDEAIAFYTEKLGFSISADVPFGNGDRWVEVSPPSGGAAIALTAPMGEWQPGRVTGISLSTRDARAEREQLEASGVELDGDMMGGEGPVPLLFSIRDQDGNSLMIVEQ
jgi:catechol 2,3-dioxygenase-like lactoylglutathione lyase family enzyme